ncbi:hypothetical protein EB796_002206 [Bugula neritina]|uniref:Uncharacterized protein n=1 Tax=Bugula neritina TaxID=10212 RepID=A0A7J7KMV0_BUGNE|nr:hypothetical protein EB796_002206 [Bugula neritina]
MVLNRNPNGYFSHQPPLHFTRNDYHLMKNCKNQPIRDRIIFYLSLITIIEGIYKHEYAKQNTLWPQPKITLK